MLEKITDASPGVDALKAVGKISKEDYENAVEPLFADARRQGRRVRLLLQLGPEYEGLTPGVAREKVTGFGFVRQVEGYALVTDIGWVRAWTQLVGFLLPWPLRVFGNDERDDAIDWLRSLPEGPGVSHRLLPDAEALVVEVDEPLRAQDFDALALTADTWLDSHDELQGIVVHARRFPGWENIEGLLRHVRFVRDRHRKVNRVALAADSALAALVPRIVEHFIHAKVKTFGYDEIEAAIAWAANPARRGSGNLATSTASADR